MSKYSLDNRPKYIYDEEQLINYWCVGFLNIDTNEIIRFKVFQDENKTINEIQQFIDFCSKCIKDKAIWIGFNNLNYDYPKCHKILGQSLFYRRESHDNFLNMSTDTCLWLFYHMTQDLINQQFDITGKRDTIPEWKHHIQQLDLFKIWHFDNKARMTSLKALEIAMGLDNVEDMPFKYNESINVNDIPIIESYNDNDLHATKEFYNITIGNTENPLYKGQDKIKLRIELSEKYNVNLLNKNDVAIGKELIVTRVSEKLNMDTKDIRKLRTYRKEIKVKNIIFPHIEFLSSEFNHVLSTYNNMILTSKDLEDVKE